MRRQAGDAADQPRRSDGEPHVGVAASSCRRSSTTAGSTLRALSIEPDARQHDVAGAHANPQPRAEGVVDLRHPQFAAIEGEPGQCEGLVMCDATRTGTTAPAS